jgi:ectoine hydroxylase-related dioxygenase (phytanoyl-CoA dioxygenase family)
VQAHITYPSNLSEPALPGQFYTAAHQFRVHGCLLLENCLDRQKVIAMRDQFLQQYASQDHSLVQKNCLQVGDKRYMFTIRVEGAFADPDIYAAPRILPVLDNLMGKDCILQSIGAVCAYPGSSMQHVHRDHANLFQEVGTLNALLPPYALTVVIPLTDLTPETGTTALWEGSHRGRNTSPDSRHSESQQLHSEGAILPWPRMGDCYFMDFRLQHGGTPNNSEIPRPILYLVYSRRWFQDRKNYETRQQKPLEISQAEYDRLPVEHRHLFENAVPE